MFQALKQLLTGTATQTLGARSTRTDFVGGIHYAATAQEARRYASAIRNIPIVSASVRLYINSLAQATPTLIAADDSRAAENFRNLTDAAFLSAPGISWQSLIRQLGLHKFYGYSVHEWTVEQIDGIFRFSDISPRPFRTLDRFAVEPDGTVTGVHQERTFIPREKLLYLVDDSIDTRPTGFGLLASIAEPLARLELFERLEKIGLGNDLRGVLIGRAPVSSMTEEQARKALAALNSFMQNQGRDLNQHLILDSAPHPHPTADRLAPTPKYNIETLKGGATAIPDVARAIDRLRREVAIGMGTAFLLDGEKSTGSLASMREKTSQFSLVVDEGLRTIREAVQRDLIRPLFELNRWPLQYAPTLGLEEAQYITTADKVSAAIALNNLPSDDPARNELRAELGLSPYTPTEEPTQ